MKSEKSDYLKYWRVVRYYLKAKHQITQPDLDMILFLYSEGYFSKDKFAEFNNVISWDVSRFERMKRNGWIEVFRKHGGGRKAIYRITEKTTRVIENMYDILNGDEIPTTIGANPMFKRNVKYSDKIFRNLIVEMNKFIRQQRRPSLE
jgi:DNA-binding MarR family transcriptional regulator